MICQQVTWDGKYIIIEVNGLRFATSIVDCEAPGLDGVGHLLERLPLLKAVLLLLRWDHLPTARVHHVAPYEDDNNNGNNGNINWKNVSPYEDNYQ